MWTCPECDRKFRNENQAHSCSVVAVESHLEKKPPEVRMAYEKLIREVKKFGDVTITAVQNGILVSSESNFFSLKPKAKYLEVEFLLDEERDEFPVHKIFRLSKKRIAHYIEIGSADEVDKHMLSFIHRAFKAVGNRAEK